MTFYIDKSPSFLLEETQSFFIENEILLLDHEKADRIIPKELFDLVTVGKNFLCLPRGDMVNTPIPYEPLDHCDHEIEGVAICKIIEEYVRNSFGIKKYLLSGRPDVFFAIECTNFTYDILNRIQPGHLTTPMILFDDTKLRIIFFDFDLGINVLSRSPSIGDEVIFEKSNKYWISYFNKNFIKGISYNLYHIDLINKYFSPLIDGLKIT